MRLKGAVVRGEIEKHWLQDDGSIPNNAQLPLLVYSHTLELPETDPASMVEQVLRDNHWGGSWRDSIYPYHHYHSTAHEVLIVYCGQASVRLGGESGITRQIEAGDVLILPAGTGHKALGMTQDFAVVGAYPEGQDWDMRYGKADERPKADKNIAEVPLPKADPIYGEGGPLMELWK